MCSAYARPGINLSEDTRKYNIPLDHIEQAVCEAFCVTPEELRQKNRGGKITRKDETVKARQTFYWLANKYTRLSLFKIGVWFIQNSANVFHAIRAVQNLVDTKDKEYLYLIKDAEQKLIVKNAINHEKTTTALPPKPIANIRPPVQPHFRNQNLRQSKQPLPQTGRRIIAHPCLRRYHRIQPTT